jgi:hypothetical protein
VSRLVQALAVAGASALVTAACGPPAPDCIARGAVHPYTGTASYVGEVGGSVSGAAAASVLVDDFSPDCHYDAMEFTVHAAGCLLWARLDGVGRSDASVSVGAGQQCTLYLAEDRVALTIDTGTLTFANGGVHVVLGGPAARAADGGTGGTVQGHLQWVFDGQ